MPTDEAKQIADRVAGLQAAIAEAAQGAGRDADEITLLAVSKKQSAARVQAAYDAGLRDFGENYVQGMQEHVALLPADVRWHFIGHLQSKKAKLVSGVALVHSLDSEKLARKLATGARDAGRVLPCLVNVNISMQDSKSGIVPDALIPLLTKIAALPELSLQGLMCIPSQAEEPRRAFARLRELRDRAEVATGLTLPELSMGMSSDYRDAIAEGSTIIRIGTQLFGERDATEAAVSR